MIQKPRRLDAKRDAGAIGGDGPTTSTPRWVKLGGILAIVFLGVHLLTGGGPGMHNMLRMPASPTAN